MVENHNNVRYFYHVTVRYFYLADSHKFENIRKPHHPQFGAIMMNKMVNKNNQGAALLENGYYKDARTVLNSALAQVRSYIQNDGKESDDDLETLIISDEQGQPDTMEGASPASRLDASRTFEKACSQKTGRRR